MQCLELAAKVRSIYGTSELCDRVSIVVECAAGCDSCVMSGAGNCDGPACEDGFYIDANFLCTSKFSSTLQLLPSIN